MMIHVAGGEINGSSLAVTNILNQIHYKRRVTAVRTNGDKSPMSILAQDWARQRRIPTTTTGHPKMVIVAWNPAGEDLSALMTPREEAKRIWQEAMISEPPPNALQRIVNVIRARDTVWVNTMNEAYLRPG